MHISVHFLRVPIVSRCQILYVHTCQIWNAKQTSKTRVQLWPDTANVSEDHHVGLSTCVTLFEVNIEPSSQEYSLGLSNLSKPKFRTNIGAVDSKPASFIPTLTQFGFTYMRNIWLDLCVFHIRNSPMMWSLLCKMHCTDDGSGVLKCYPKLAASGLEFPCDRQTSKPSGSIALALALSSLSLPPKRSGSLTPTARHVNQFSQ